MTNTDTALEHASMSIARDVIDVYGREVTVSTLWLPSPWFHHETAIFWDGDNHFHVVSTDAGSVDAVKAHMHWTCFPTLAAYVLEQEDPKNWERIKFIEGMSKDS